MKPRLAPRGAVYHAANQVLRPVFGLDIDGTMGYYHEHFTRYAEEFLQKSIWDQDPLWDGSKPFWKLFGVSKTTYREMKLGYRQGRLKRSMPVIAGAAELARELRAAGAEVWMCTTRPYLRLDAVEPDTRWWLRHHGIQYDGLLSGEWKYRDLAKIVGAERVLGILDDEPEHVARARTLGLNAFLIDRQYNRNVNDKQRMSSLGFAQGVFVEQCQRWREEHGV